jgi:RHS repeat-associated protein
MESKVNFTKDRYAQIEVSYQYEEDDENQVLQTLTDTVVIPFEQFITDWQFARDSFVLKGDTDQITVLFRYAKNANDAYITDLQLNLDEKAVAYETSDDEEEEIPEETCPCEGCEEVDCPCDCVDEEHCNCIQCKRRSGVTTEDSFGNVLTNSSFDGIYSIITSDTYTVDGNYIATSTDADNGTVTYGYNTLNGCLDSLTDANNHTTNYGYDAYGLLVSVSAANSNNTTSSATYTYTNDRLTAITHNGFSYNFTYDIWGQLTQVSVGSQPIVSYTYGSGINRTRLNSVTYHNSTGSETVYEYYYTNGNVSSIEVNGDTRFEFAYDELGDLSEITTTDIRTIKYTDGRTDILDIDENYIYSSYTDDDGNLVEVIGSLTYTTTDYDSDYTASTGITVNKSDYAVSDGRVVGTLTSSDWFGRTSQEVVKTESAVDENDANNYAAITTCYGYPSYPDSKTSERVKYVTNRVTYGTSTANQTKFYGFSYDYDANGNITAEYRRGTGGGNSLLRSYSYDNLNQLVRVNVVGGSTYVYEYDSAGNITAIKEYIYTTDPVILDDPETTSYYTYDNTWKDRLTSAKGKTYTYDDIGNPITIGNDTLTWEGRALQTYTKGTKTFSYSYDENGLRTKKTVTENETVTKTYDYVWSDGKLISQAYNDGTDDYAAKFIYGSNGDVQGFIYDDTTYLYIKNLMGDIVAVIDEEGQEIARISYDVWGDLEFTVGGDGNNAILDIVKNISPFTYRGYCYDIDIGLYYLQSRFYDPVIGRFINTDDTSIAVSTLGNPLGANLFAYCENNPVNFVDCSGYKSKIFSLKSDWAGREILLHYLYGNGKELKKTDQKWADYMMKNKLLKEQIRDYLSKRIKKIKFSSNGSYSINESIKAEIENGEDIIGYQYLHGTNKNVGGFHMTGFILRRKVSGKYEYTFLIKYSWNDIIDPNYKYSSDAIKATIGKAVSFGKAKDYTIRIYWADISVLYKDKWKSGWLK